MKKLIFISCIVLFILTISFALSQEKGFIRIRDKRTNEMKTLKIYNKSYAVCIGIDEYSIWPKLNYAVADAVEMRNKLLEMGFDQVKLIKNEEATADNIIKAISWLGEVAESDDRVIIYFSGHGHTIEGRTRTVGYIIPVDCPKNNYYENAISMAKLKEATEVIKAKHILYIMDSCYSGIGLISRADNEEFMVEMAKDPCVYMITAGKAGEEAIETGGHGIFTKYILRGLKGEADYDKDGVVTGTELGLYSRKWVSNEAKELKKTQTPQFGRIDGEGEIVFTTLGVDEPIPEKPSDSKFSLDDLKTEADKLEAIEKIKQTWASKLTEMKSAFNEVKAYEVRDITPSLKVTAWSRFIETFKEDNPYTQEDDTMRQQARTQLDYWQKIKPEEAKHKIDTSSNTIIGKDGAEMVLIPAGEFLMGSNDGSSNEKPVHTVYLDAFYIDKYEVTNAQYKKFMDATGHKAPAYWNDPRFNNPTQPVVGVSWYDAKAYADWAEKRLPTEAEWEKSARGGLVGKKYPWGDKITHDDANYEGTGGKDIWECTSPVGSFAPNGYGLYDMAGNVWEWCADWYDGNYYKVSPKENPKGPTSVDWRVIRGGSWGNGIFILYLRVAVRISDDPTYMLSNVGFRCAQ